MSLTWGYRCSWGADCVNSKPLRPLQINLASFLPAGQTRAHPQRIKVGGVLS
jgi:hypothetical protein